MFYRNNQIQKRHKSPPQEKICIKNADYLPLRALRAASDFNFLRTPGFT